MQNMLLITINFVVFGMLFHCNLRYGTLFIVEGRERRERRWWQGKLAAGKIFHLDVS